MAQVAETESDRRIGTLVGGRWRLERRLGSGGMATVYAATDEKGQRAAVKVLHEEMARKTDVRQRFLNEAYVANRIGHPGAVQILEHGEGADTYLVMELLDGVPLSERLQAANQMTVRELLGYADQILDVLAAAHAAGVVHRDIKPDNVFVTQEGRIKILDFGIARVLDDVPQAFKTRTGLALGTIPYMAPEQALGKRAQLDGRVDLFALGALLFRVLAGRRIHEAPSEAELLVAMATQPAPKLASIAPSVPEPVCKVIDTALAYAREARYPDANTMQTDVRAVLAGSAPPYVTGAVVAHRDEPTRVGAAAPVPSASFDAPTRLDAPAPVPVPASLSFDAPTRIEAAPVSQAPVSLAQPPVSQAPTSVVAAMSLDAPPVSQAPMSLAGPPSATLPAVVAAPPARKSRGAFAIVLLLGFGVLVLGGVAAAAAGYFAFGQDAPSTATSETPGLPANLPAAAGQEGPANDMAGSGTSTSSTASQAGAAAPAQTSTAGAGTAEAEPGAKTESAPTSTAGGSTAAPTTTTTSTGAVAPAPKSAPTSTGGSSPGSAPPPAPTPAPTAPQAATTPAAAPAQTSTPPAGRSKKDDKSKAKDNKPEHKKPR